MQHRVRRRHNDHGETPLYGTDEAPAAGIVGMFAEHFDTPRHEERVDEGITTDSLATPDLLDWPRPLGADVLDGDGNPHNYNLPGGDRPRLYGDQTAFWVMNDWGNVHPWAQTEPIGMEVQAHAFAFDSFREALEATTFYRYVLTYKGEHPLENAFIGLWGDVVLGTHFNDHAGCDTTLDLGFGYDGDHTDARFEGRPPAVGIALLQGPVVAHSGVRDILGMTTFMEIRRVDDGPRHGSIDAYRFMQGRWDDDTPATFGGGGYGGNTPTRFMFPGDEGVLEHGEYGR